MLQHKLSPATGGTSRNAVEEDVKLGEKIQTMLPCQAFRLSVVVGPRRHINVLHLCHATGLIHRSRNTYLALMLEICQNHVKFELNLCSLTF